MQLLENMLSEPVSKLAIREPVTAVKGDSIRNAIERMRQSHLGCTIVIDKDNKPVGMLTEAMLTQLLSENAGVVDEAVEAHLSSQWPRVKISDPIADVLEALELKNIRFLCVIDEEGRLVGLTGQKGLMEYVAEHFPQQINVQRIGGNPFLTKREGA